MFKRIKDWLQKRRDGKKEQGSLPPVLPKNVDHPEQSIREAVAEAFNTGKPVFGRRDGS